MNKATQINRLAIIVILNIFVISYLSAQGQTFCETVSPEQDRLEQIGMTGYSQTLDQVIIKIWLHIIRDSNGNGGLTWDQATNAITIMASDYEDGGIYFFMDGSDEIHDDYYYNFTSPKFNQLIQVNAHSDAIDIYLLPTNVWNAGKASGIPGLALVLGGTLFDTQLAGSSVLSHEMGHCLALYHTHHGIEPGGCMEEIDGSNCLQCGDFICDTPADPGIWFQVDANCNYTGGAVDPNGIPYQPDTHNIMSYSKPNCLDYLSDGQFERSYTFIENDPIFASVIIIPSISEPVPNTPTILTWSNNGGKPKLSWNQSSTTDIVGYKIYRNLHGCGPDCGPYKYIGYTVGYEATTFTDYVVDIGGRFSFNYAYYYVDAFALDLVTESSPTNTIFVPTNMAEKRAVDITEKPIPTSFSISQNYPNPFNPITTISYQLPASRFVNMSLYNIQGILVETLVNEYKEAGFYSVQLNADNISSGLYFYRIEAGEYSETKKCVILK